MLNFQKTTNFLRNYFDVKSVFVFSPNKAITCLSYDDLFKKYFYYAPSELKFQKMTENNVYFNNMNKTLDNLTFSRSSCAIETENEIAIFLPLSILVSSNFSYSGGDFFEPSPKFSEKSLIIPDINAPIDFFFDKKTDNHTINVYTTFPYFGASIITDITKKTKEEAKETLNSTFQLLQKQFKSNSFPLYFFRYYKVFECQEHTRFFAYYSPITNDPLIFVEIPTPKYSIMEYCYESLGRTNLASVLHSNIIITQEYAHGPWTVWYDEERTQESCNIILSVLREKFTQPNFIKFLKNLYSTEVIPYNLYEDIFVVSFKDILCNLNGGCDEGNIL